LIRADEIVKIDESKRRGTVLIMVVNNYTSSL